MNPKKIFILFILTVAGVSGMGYWIAHHHDICPPCSAAKIFSPGVIRHFISGFGPWAIVIYIVLYTLNTISIVPPIAILSLSAGFLFGPYWGFIALTLGALCGTTATFFLSRHFGGACVDRIVKGKAARFQDKLGQNGFWVILPIRLIGLPPWEFVNYAAGLTHISYRDYIAATMIGILPAVVIQVFFSDRLSEFNFRDPTLYLAVGAFILLAVIPAMLINKKNKGPAR